MKSDVVPDGRKYVPLDDAAKKLGYKSIELEKKAFTKLVDVRSVGNIKYLDRSVFDKIMPVETHSAEWGSVSFIQNLFSADRTELNPIVKPISNSLETKDVGIKIISKRVEIKKESIHSADGLSIESVIDPKISKIEEPLKEPEPQKKIASAPEEHDGFLPKLIKKESQLKEKALPRAHTFFTWKRPVYSVGSINTLQPVTVRGCTTADQKKVFDPISICATLLFVVIMFIFTQSLAYIILNKNDIRLTVGEAVHKPLWALDAMIESAIDSYGTYTTTLNKAPYVVEKTVGETMYTISTAIYDRGIEITGASVR
jgi:hypothetical protein